MAGAPKLRESRAARPKRRPARQESSNGTCFVLMPFKEPFESYYTVIIRPAALKAGLTPIRGDSIFRSSAIMADIWQLIRNATLVIADLSEKNANVFYELGLAHSIGKPVILLADNIADVPFDLQALRVIVYDKNVPDWGDRLSDSIALYIAETMRDTTGAIPAMFRNPVASQAPPEPQLSVRVAAIEQELASLRQRSLAASHFATVTQPAETISAGEDLNDNSDITLKSRIDAAQRSAFEDAYRRGRTNNERALLLGITRSHFYELLKRYGSS